MQKKSQYRAISASVTSHPSAVSATPSRAPSAYSSRLFSRHTSCSAFSSALVYTVPTSVDCEIYTTRGFTICGAMLCSASTARTPSGRTLPSSSGMTSTLCPVASMAPVSWTKIWQGGRGAYHRLMRAQGSRQRNEIGLGAAG